MAIFGNDGVVQKAVGTGLNTVALAVTLVRRTPGSLNTTTLKPATGSTTTYTTRGFVLANTDFYARTGVAQVGSVTFGVLRKSTLWSSSRTTPRENDKITCDGRTGVVMRVHTDDAMWVLDCSE